MPSANTPEGLPAFEPKEPQAFIGAVAIRLVGMRDQLAIALVARCALRVLPLTADNRGVFPRRWRWQQAKAPYGALALAMQWAAGQEINESDLKAAGRHTRLVSHEAEYEAHFASYAAAYAIPGINEKSANYRIALDSAFTACTQRAPALAPLLAAAVSSDFLQAHLISNEKQNLLQLLAAPLWADHALFERYLKHWEAAIRALSRAGQENAIEGGRIIQGYRIFFYGGPPVDTPEPVSLPPNFANEDLALLLARLALDSSSDLALAEAPTVESFQAALKRREHELRDFQEVVRELEAKYSHFHPDPVWLAWIQANSLRFFTDVRSKITHPEAVARIAQAEPAEGRVDEPPGASRPMA